ncbi:MAG TPA: hypothetical protein VGK17_00680 [Propionicimonas sp.]|jgi:hypothetical protein
MPFGFLKRRSDSTATAGQDAPWSSGGAAAPARFTGNHHVNVNVTYFSRIRPDAALQVVGEAYRQENVALARPPVPGDLPDGMPAPPPGYFKAMLLPEPGNQYDPNAVAVALWAGGSWTLSGYLSRADAVRYQPLFRHLGRDGSAPGIACDAAVVREGLGRGVVLHLGSPGECIAELITDDRQPADHPWAGKLIAFTGRSKTTITGVVIDREAQLMLAAWAGCDVLPRVTKKIQALIAAEPRDPTGNTQKAREYGISVVDEVDFLRQIGLPPETIARDDLAWARQ